VIKDLEAFKNLGKKGIALLVINESRQFFGSPSGQTGYVLVACGFHYLVSKNLARVVSFKKRCHRNMWKVQSNLNYWNLDYLDLDYPDYSIIQTFFWSQFFHEYKLVVILKTQSRKKPNNPFKRLLKQRTILCALKFASSTRQRNILMRSADI